MSDLSVIFLLFMEKIMLKATRWIQTRVLRKNKPDTYWAPIFAPDYSATVLAAKMCTNSNEHSNILDLYDIAIKMTPQQDRFTH